MIVLSYEACEMAPQREHTEIDPHPKNMESIKRDKKGFTVGPENLPDGTHRRKGRIRGI